MNKNDIRLLTCNNLYISNKGKWNNCISIFSNQVLPPIFISAILQSRKFLNLALYFPCDVKFQLLAHSRSFLANQKARNAIVGAENLLKQYIHKLTFVTVTVTMVTDIIAILINQRMMEMLSMSEV